MSIQSPITSARWVGVECIYMDPYIQDLSRTIWTERPGQIAPSSIKEGRWLIEAQGPPNNVYIYKQTPKHASDIRDLTTPTTPVWSIHIIHHVCVSGSLLYMIIRCCHACFENRFDRSCWPMELSQLTSKLVGTFRHYKNMTKSWN